MAVFGSDYIPGLIIEALNPRGKCISVKNTETTEGGAQHVKRQDMELLIALCSKCFLQRTLLSLQRPGGCRLYCQLSSYPFFSDGTGEKWERRKERWGKEKTFCIFLKNQIIYIEKSGFHILIQERTMSMFFVVIVCLIDFYFFLSSAYGKYSLLRPFCGGFFSPLSVWS